MPTVGVAAALLIFLIVISILAAWIGVVLRLAFGERVLPPSTPRYVPWGAGSIVLVVLLYLVLQIAVPTGYLIATHPRIPGAAARVDLSPSEQMTLSAIVNALVLVFIPLVLAGTAGATRRDFGLVGEGFFRQVFRGLIAYPLLAPVVFGVMIGSVLIWKKTNHPLEDAIRLNHSPSMLMVMALAGVVFAPLAEELIFRGVLLGWLTRLAIGRSQPEEVTEFIDGPDVLPPDPPGFGDSYDRDSDNPYAAPATSLVAPVATEVAASSSRTIMLILANVAVSVVFAGLHAAVWPTPIPIFFLSLGLGLLYQRTGSLIPSMTLHMTFNGVSTLMMILTLVGSPAKDAEKTKTTPKPTEVIEKIEVKPTASIVDLNVFVNRNH